jgi:hypothetical protein
LSLRRKQSLRGKSQVCLNKKKHVVAVEQQKAQTDPFVKTDENVDILSTPQIEPSTRYPPRAKELEVTKVLPTTALLDLEELAEGRLGVNVWRK